MRYRWLMSPSSSYTSVLSVMVPFVRGSSTLYQKGDLRHLLKGPPWECSAGFTSTTTLASGIGHTGLWPESQPAPVLFLHPHLGVQHSGSFLQLPIWTPAAEMNFHALSEANDMAVISKEKLKWSLPLQMFSHFKLKLKKCVGNLAALSL